MGSKMKTMKVIKNADGQVINIGEWDYMYQEQIVQKTMNLSELTTETNIDDYKPKNLLVARNQMPEGAFEDEADVVVGADGGLYLANDPRVSQVG
jgi:ABC-type uncharacterized transport system involved in gliding motility auxiliary subunit